MSVCFTGKVTKGLSLEEGYEGKKFSLQSWLPEKHLRTHNATLKSITYNCSLRYKETQALQNYTDEQIQLITPTSLFGLCLTFSLKLFK